MESQLETSVSRRVEAVTSFLLERDMLLPLVAFRLGSDAVFESAIRGESMTPAIPGRARVRVRLLSTERCKRGDIVFYLGVDGFMIHRVIFLANDNAAESLVLTLGDNCLIPDPPIREDRLLGRVVAVQTESGWCAPGSPPHRSLCHRMARAMASMAVIGALQLSFTAACGVQIMLRKVESAARPWIGRALRKLGISFAADHMVAPHS